MKDIDYSQECVTAYDKAMFAAREEVRIFCAIMDCSYEMSFNVADDPHGPVSIGDYFFNMSEVHSVIKMYDDLRRIYKTNAAISDAIIEWYDYSIDMYENQKDEPRINLHSWLYGARPGMFKEEASHD